MPRQVLLESFVRRPVPPVCLSVCDFRFCIKSVFAERFLQDRSFRTVSEFISLAILLLSVDFD